MPPILSLLANLLLGPTGWPRTPSGAFRVLKGHWHYGEAVYAHRIQHDLGAATGEIHQALAIFEAEGVGGPIWTWARLTQAAFAREEGRMEASAAIAQSVLDAADPLAGWNWLIGWFGQVDRHQAVLSCFGRLGPHLDHAPPASQATAWIWAGRAHAGLGAPGPALEAFERARQGADDPQMQERCLVWIAHLLQQTHRPAQAAELLQEAVRSPEAGSEVWAALGAAEHSLDRWAASTEAYRRALALAPRSERPGLQRWIGHNLALHQDAPQEAVPYLRAAVHRLGGLDRALALFDLGRAHRRLGQDAAPQLVEAIAIATAGEASEASPWFEHSVVPGRFPVAPPAPDATLIMRMRAELGLALHALGRRDEAKAVVGDVVQQAQRDVILRGDAAVSEEMLGWFQECQRAVGG